ncbi:MAG: winged helix-turn-helix domain-containing protein [Candidatus Methanomethylicia archaeon]|nr:winged helix-turn-helix domain-containing protein [Candidatus Methanomethylicia archaeon]MCX8169204.1 winged helix-turn-helix domain-containing protein [Candidatus Methanomethylicia archaeon]MDW7989014.1 winged helix-turn-helix domain-containing protein [Nitrososphaerota archaeon]
MEEKIEIEDLKIASEETRLKILILLRSKELGLNDLSKLTGKAKSTISEHLKILVERNLIERFQVDKGYNYKLTNKGVKILELMQKSVGDIKIESKRKLTIKDGIDIIKVRLTIPLLTGASMIILGGVHNIIILLSIINGLILGFLNSNYKDLLKGGVIFSSITSIVAALRIGVTAIPVTYLLTIVIYISIGGLTWIILKIITGLAKKYG